MDFIRLESRGRVQVININKAKVGVAENYSGWCSAKRLSDALGMPRAPETATITVQRNRGTFRTKLSNPSELCSG